MTALPSNSILAALSKGWNRICVQLRAVAKTARPALFQLGFRRRGSVAELERLARLALKSDGDAKRGQAVFFDVEKSRCLQCHRFGVDGGPIGPDLTGVGRRFSRIHLIESILEPGRTIAAGYDTLAVVLADGGGVVTGVKIAESDSELTLGDSDGRSHIVPKSRIERRLIQSASTMPQGLERQLSDQEFIDLIAFLTASR